MTFEELMSEALAASFSGWDFSWLRGRSRTEPPPWNYRSEVSHAAAGVDSMLDMGTGGGEVLAAIAGRPRLTIATEAWPPNVPLAARRLGPLGVHVLQVEGAPDNFEQDGANGGRVPFRDASFGLVANRHEAFLATEVARILWLGGMFVTQQVDFGSYDDLYTAFGRPLPAQRESWLPLAVRQLEAAGLELVRANAADERHSFNDVGALVYYLRAVSWSLPGFDPVADDRALRRIHADIQRQPFVLRQRRFLLIARKPN